MLAASLPAQAHQVNLSTARVTLDADRSVAVEVALKGSDADRVAGTHIFDSQWDLVDPALVAASAAPIIAYMTAHVAVTGRDGTACLRGHRHASCPMATASFSATSFRAATSPGDILYRSTVLTATDPSARQVVLIGEGAERTAGAARRQQYDDNALGACAFAVVDDAALSRHRHRAYLPGLRSHRVSGRASCCGRGGLFR